MKITNLDSSNELYFIYDKSVFSGVKKIAEKVAQDIERVFDFKPEFADCLCDVKEHAVIFGTVGKSDILDNLEKSGKIKLDEIRGKNEVYGFFVLDEVIVIAGSDKRGTIYGLFHLSELIGVSPLVNWANIQPKKLNEFDFTNEHTFISKTPSVRFRGFFINDEWPAFGNWCNKRFGGFNTKCYENIFELLLRLKGNYLWPAMWSSRFSDDGPGLANAELADELGVIMGASHHEPCCRAGEEYRHLRGPDSIYGDAWNFRSNRDGITKFWEDGLKRNGKFENVITVGMRGEADTAILKNATLKDNIELLRDVLKVQNDLIKKYVNPDLTKVPRMLALYKEVEPYFYGDEKTPGLMDSPELEGVTLMLCDDNHGNLRTVPTEKMRNHNGGYGMYYHFDYHGSPFSYEWINTSYLPKVKEQMTAAYDFGIRDLWIVNVGDVATNEFPLSYFLDLAYDYEKFSDLEYTTRKYTAEWVKRQFNRLTDEQQKKIEYILNGYTKLAHLRRTECIWPETYHPVNFNESDIILEKAEDIIKTAEELRSQISSEDLPGFYAQVYYPAMGNMNVLKMQLLTGNLYASKIYAQKVRECLEFDKKLVDEYDKIDNGRWYAMGWSEHFGFTHWNEEENQYPVLVETAPVRKRRMFAWVDGNEIATSGLDWCRIPLFVDAFKNPEATEAKIKIAHCIEETVPYELSFDGEDFKNADTTWLSTEVSHDKELLIDTVTLKIDRKKLTAVSEKNAIMKIQGNDGRGGRILVIVKIDADVPDCNFEKGTFIQTKPYIAIEAEHFARCTDGKSCDGKNASFKVLEGYGKTLSAVKAYPVIEYFDPKKAAPSVEYDFTVTEDGTYNFYYYMNPSNPATKDNNYKFAAGVNGSVKTLDIVSKDFAVGDNQEPWGTDVTNNIRIVTTSAECKKGKNTLKVYAVTPNLVLEKIVIAKENTIIPESYLGPAETYFVK